MNELQVKEEVKGRCKTFLQQLIFSNNLAAIILRSASLKNYSSYAALVIEAMQEVLDDYRKAFDPKRNSHPPEDGSPPGL